MPSNSEELTRRSEVKATLKAFVHAYQEGRFAYCVALKEEHPSINFSKLEEDLSHAK